MILIRADANEHIGTGHVMRCLSIARAFNKAGEEVMFIAADHRSGKLIEGNGFGYVCLESDWEKLEDELPSVKKVIAEKRPALLLIDSYYVTEKYFQELSSVVKTAYVDDLNKDCWDVDWLINYNIFADVYDYSQYADKRTKLIMGPNYAPLRDEFKERPQHRIRKKVRDVLVSAGGSDPEQMTEKLIREVCPSYKDTHFHFVVGAMNPRINEITKLEDGNIVLHINEKNMSTLMQSCDIAISASGSTLYELCACGTPTITFTLADNQLDAAKQFKAKGIAVYAGDSRNNRSLCREIDTYLRGLMENEDERRRFSGKMQKLVDGYGAEKIADILSGRH